MSEMYADAFCSSVSVSSCAYTVGLARFVGQFRQKQVVLCLRLSGWVRVGFFGGGLHPFPAGWRKVQRSRNAFQGGGELHGFHDYQVLWLGCGFGSIVA